MKRATTELRARACRANAFFLPAMWLTLFLPAWTLDYWQAWLYWLIYAVGTVIGTRYFLRRDPALIERQLRIAPGNAHTIKKLTWETTIGPLNLDLKAGDLENSYSADILVLI